MRPSTEGMLHLHKFVAAVVALSALVAIAAVLISPAVPSAPTLLPVSTLILAGIIVVAAHIVVSTQPVLVFLSHLELTAAAAESPLCSVSLPLRR